MFVIWPLVCCAVWNQILLGVSSEEGLAGGGEGYVPGRGDRIHIENFRQSNWKE